MAARSFTASGDAGRNPLPAIAIMAFAVVVGLIGLLMSTGASLGIPYPYLLPWLLALAIVMAIPLIVQKRRGKFTLADPIIFATLSYFYPAFVLGGLSLAAGFSHPYFLAFVQDPQINYPYTVWIIIMGYVGLAAGYFLPLGNHIGAYFERKLPTADYAPDYYAIPGSVLLFLGIANTALAIGLGLIGFQRASEIGAYDGLIFLTTLFWLEASFVLWFVIFSRQKFEFGSGVLLVLLGATALSKALYAGNRGSVIQIFIVIALAYTLSGRKFRLKQSLFAGTVLTIALLLGTIYGTTFRNVKGDESQSNFGSYSGNILETLDKIGSDAQFSTLNSGFNTFAERIDLVSSLAVVVSNYEQLAPYEESYGLDHNIVKDLSSFMVPRVIWPDKPVASESHQYSDLYFNYSENSFGITPMGDLIRNFGPIGVPLGMLVIGLLLRVLYRTFVEDQKVILWRAAIYFMILTSVSYESFYASIIPYGFKVGTTALVGVLLLNLMARALGAKSRQAVQ
ncbi:MAG: oligosaccharide repeat unit polymerase [Acidobacteria bacterium]|nr:oligosaccharide repeat unit polymerase [Acidobacteriota bacterium]